MSKKIRIWWIKSNIRIKIAMVWWIWWSNLYQKIEKKFMKTDISSVKTWVEDKRDYSDDKLAYETPRTAWSLYCGRNELYHYKKDKWYMLYDVISTPSRMMVRKGVDCDDYSFLSYFYFDSFINFDDKVYEFDGFYSIIWKNGSGHSIAIWKNPLKKDDYLMISNAQCVNISNIRRAWNLKGYGGIRSIAKYGFKDKKLILRDIDYNETDYIDD